MGYLIYVPGKNNDFDKTKTRTRDELSFSLQGQLCHGLSTILNQGQRRWFLEFYQFLAQLGSSDSSSQRGGSSHQTTTTNKSGGGAGSRSSDSPPSNTITGNQLTASPMPDLLPVQQTQSSESSSQVHLTHFCCNQINGLFVP